MSISPPTPRTALPRDRFLPLPDGDRRRVGLELEFGGLTQDAAAEVAAAVLGGTPAARDGGDIRLPDTALGRLDIYLDTALRKKLSGPLAQAGLDLSRAVVPVELVTEPIAPDDLPRAEALRSALRDAGATGTRDGLFLGFGLHLNVQTVDPGGADVPRTGLAFALLEDWLRADDPLDLSRRVLPFTQRYPRALLDALASAGDGLSPGAFFDLYAAHVPDRNRGLDLLPIFRAIDEAGFLAAYGRDTAVSARPAYHYRMPDCRIDEADWTLAYEWNRWVLVERAARDTGLLRDLGAAWQAARGGLGLLTTDWPGRVGALIAGAGLVADAGA